MENAYKISVGKPEEERTRGRSGRSGRMILKFILKSKI
jgi:hypothetical protein